MYWDNKSSRSENWTDSWKLPGHKLQIILDQRLQNIM